MHPGKLEPQGKVHEHNFDLSNQLSKENAHMIISNGVNYHEKRVRVRRDALSINNKNIHYFGSDRDCLDVHLFTDYIGRSIMGGGGVPIRLLC